MGSGTSRPSGPPASRAPSSANLGHKGDHADVYAVSGRRTEVQAELVVPRELIPTSTSPPAPYDRAGLERLIETQKHEIEELKKKNLALEDNTAASNVMASNAVKENQALRQKLSDLESSSGSPALVRENAELRQQIAELEANNAVSNAKNASISKENQGLKQRISALESNHGSDLAKENERLRDQVSDLESRVPNVDLHAKFLELKSTLDTTLQDMIWMEEENWEDQTQHDDEEASPEIEERGIVENYEDVYFPELVDNEECADGQLSLEDINAPPSNQEGEPENEESKEVQVQRNEVMDRFRGLLGEGQRLREVFNSIDTDGSGDLDQEELGKALSDLGVQVQESQVESLMHFLDKNQNGKIDFYEFRKAVHHIPSTMSEVEQLHQWLVSIDIASVLARGLAYGIQHDCLGTLMSLPLSELQTACASALEQVTSHVWESIESMKNQQQDMPQEVKSDHQKFALAGGATTGFYGARHEFLQPLADRIGLPLREVWDGMLAEHHVHADSELEFFSERISAATTPKQEWSFVVEPTAGANYHGREIRQIADLLTHEKSVHAGLTMAELVALRLFSGPMYAKYNARLRRGPREVFEGTKGNTYVCTLHSVTSGLKKLARLYKVEDIGTMYCGLTAPGLPIELLESSDLNWRGVVDLGLISATASRDLALRGCTGAAWDGAPPTILTIQCGTTDVGAPMSWLAQFPWEQEIAFPPNCNLELSGASRVEWVAGWGIVVVKPLLLRVSPRVATLEETASWRQGLHLDSIQHAINSAHLALVSAIRAGAAHRAQAVVENASTAAKSSDGARDHVREWLGDLYDLERASRERGAAWFEDDDNWFEAAVELSKTKVGAVKRFQLFHKLKRQGWGSNAGGDGAAWRGPAALLAARLLPARRFAEKGYEQRVRSRFAEVDFGALAEGALKAMPAQLKQEAALLAWECIEQRVQADPAAKVVIRGRGGFPVEVGVRYLNGELRALRGFKGDDLEMNKPWFGLDMAPIAAPAMLANPLLLSARVESTPIPVLKTIRAVRVDLTGYRFSPAEAFVLVEVLRKCRSLTSLHLDENLGEEAEAELAHVITGPGPGLGALTNLNGLSLAVLNDKRRPLRSYEAAFLAKRMAKDASFTSLHGLSLHEADRLLSGVQVDRIGWELSSRLVGLNQALATAFVGSRVRSSGLVTSLNVASNALGSQGGELLARHLAHLSTLVVLSVADNALGPAGCAHVAGAAASLAGLRSLNLSSNQGREEGCVALCAAASLMRQLETLSWVDNGTTPAAARAVAFLLRSRPSLRCLSLIGNDIASEEWSREQILSSKHNHCDVLLDPLPATEDAPAEPATL